MFAFSKFQRPIVQSTICVICLSVILLSSNCVAQEKFNLRIWSDNSGTFSVEAELINYSTNEIQLKKLNGVVITVPVSRLSSFDTKFVRRLNEKKRLAQNPPAAQRTLVPSQPINSRTPALQMTNRKNTIPQTPSSQFSISQSLNLQSQPTRQPPSVRVKFGDSPSDPQTNLNPPVISDNDFADNKPPIFSSTTEPQTKIRSNDFAVDASIGDTAPKTGMFQALNGNNNRRSRSIDTSADRVGESDSENVNVKSEWNNFNDDSNAGPKPSGSILDLPTPRPLKIDEKIANKFKDIGSTANSSRLPPNVLGVSTNLEPEQYSELASQIANLSDRTTVRSSLNLLSGNWPSEPSQQLLDAVRNASKSPDARSRKIALDLLASFDGQQSLPWILDSIDDKSFGVRWAAYSWLEKLQDVRSIEPLFEKFEKGGSEQAAKAIASFGPVAEPYALDMLDNKSYIVRKSACSLLAKIGSQTSLAKLKDLAANGEKISVRMQASNAIETITKRIGK